MLVLIKQQSQNSALQITFQQNIYKAMNKLELVPEIVIANKIYLIRKKKVMLSFDLAELYEVETKRLNEQVKRNIGKFPERFMFQLTQDEYLLLRSQNATFKMKVPYYYNGQSLN
jgi:hypothetical protein